MLRSFHIQQSLFGNIIVRMWYKNGIWTLSVKKGHYSLVATSLSSVSVWLLKFPPSLSSKLVTRSSLTSKPCRYSSLWNLCQRFDSQRQIYRFYATPSNAQFIHRVMIQAVPYMHRTTQILEKQTAFDRGQTDRISLTHDRDLDLWPQSSVSDGHM